MKAKVYALTAHGPSGLTLHSKLFVAAIIIALITAFLPMASALAAPAHVLETDDLAREWKTKLDNLRAHSLFYIQVRLYPADFEDATELAQAQALLDKYGFALKKATTVVSTRAGFDINGKVTNEKLAAQSVADLAESLRIMRAIWTQLDEQDVKIHRLR